MENQETDKVKALVQSILQECEKQGFTVHDMHQLRSTFLLEVDEQVSKCTKDQLFRCLPVSW